MYSRATHFLSYTVAKLIIFQFCVSEVLGKINDGRYFNFTCTGILVKNTTTASSIKQKKRPHPDSFAESCLRSSSQISLPSGECASG